MDKFLSYLGGILLACVLIWIMAMSQMTVGKSWQQERTNWLTARRADGFTEFECLQKWDAK